MQLSENPSIFCCIFFVFFGIYIKFPMFWKKTMNLIGQVYLKLFTPKCVLIQIHQWICFWKRFGGERVNEYQKLLKSAEKYFYPTFSSFWAKLSDRKLFLIRSETLGLLVKKLSANYEYSRSNRENLPLPIQMQLSENPSIFCCIFFVFLESTLNFQCSEKNNEPDRSSISEFTVSERCVDLNV